MSDKDSKKIVRAGVIPYCVLADGTVEMMFMRPSNPKYGGPDWQCCKGKVEEGETVKEAGIREAEEELGLVQDNISGDVHKIGVFLGRTHMYVCEINCKDTFTAPHYETGAVTWMTAAEFRAYGRKLHFPIVKVADSTIKDLLKKEQ